MNSSQPSPFQSNSTPAQPARRARVKLAVFSVLAVNAIFCVTLLLTPGCKRDTSGEQTTVDPMAGQTNLTDLASSNLVSDPWIDTNASGALPTNGVPPIVDTHFNPQPPVAAATTYTIQSGDTFEKIAKTHGTTISAIQAANPGVDPRRLKINSTINLPAPSAAGAAPVAEAAPAVSGETIYVVKSGDTLTKIAARFGTTVPAIKRLNGLSTDRINVKDKLKIPVKAPAPVAPMPEPLPVAPTVAPSAAPAPATLPAR